jgi:hypothetical protein
MSSAKGIIGLMVGVGLGLLIMWLIKLRTPGGSPKTMINGIPFKPGVSPILDAIGRVQSETNEALRGPLCNAIHTAELGILEQLENIQEPMTCVDLKLLLQQERDDYITLEFDDEEDTIAKKIAMDLYTEIDLLINKIDKRFCKKESDMITGKDILTLIKEVRDAFCYDKDEYDKVTIKQLVEEVGYSTVQLKRHMYDPMIPYTDVIRDSISWLESTLGKDDTPPAPWENRTLIAGAEGNPQSCIELAEGEPDDEELIFMHDDSDPRLADFVIGGQTPEDAFANGALHACRQIEKRIVRESDDSGPTSITLPTATERFNRYGDACEVPEDLIFEEYHTSLAPVETPNIDEYVRGKKTVCLFYDKEDLQAAATAEEEAENDT